MTPPAELPSFRTIAAALRKTTEHLATELQFPSTVAPPWSEFEWSIARAVAAMQGISGLLARGLRWRGPDVWRAFLDEQLALSVARDVRIDALIAGIDAALREAGVGCVALKGAVLRAAGLYRPGDRPMSDVDLLSRTEDVAKVRAALLTLDYVPAFEVQRHEVFELRGQAASTGYGEHPDNPLKVEVHTKIAEALPVRVVDITANLPPDAIRPGLNSYRDRGALMQHLLLHAASNMRAHALRQVQLHDIALLARNLDARDWDTALKAERSGCWWALPPLELTERYYAGSIPAAALEFVRARAPRLLRAATARSTLTQVSWSNLRIAAFPGITWTRTPLEALRFARSRLIPERRALDEMRVAQATQPSTLQVPWYQQSHANRIVRWLFSSPPRVQTMVSVRAALGRPVP